MRRLVFIVALLLLLTTSADAKLGGGSSFRGGSGGTRSSSSRSSRSSSSSSSRSSSSRSSGSSSWGSSGSSGFRWSSSGSSGSYSGSSSWSSSSSGGGDLQMSEADLPACCFVLCLVIAIVLVVVVISNQSQTTPARFVRPREPEQVRTRGESSWLSRLTDLDPSFSLPVFLDFAVLLYMRAQESRGKGFAALRPYLSERAIAALPPLEGEVDEICVGGANVIEPQVGHYDLRLVVRFEASMTVERDGRRKTLCSHERWVFQRPTNVLSKGPDEALALGCPSCGNPSEVKRDGSCTACGAVVADGRFNWQVHRIDVTKRWTQDPDELGSSGGDERPPPTAVDEDYESDKRAFKARYPGFTFHAFEALIRERFLALQRAWTERSFERARPYESDALFQTHRFWIESFKRHGRTNVLEDVVVEKVQGVKIARDAFFDAITVRIWMRMIDYTRDDTTGRVLSGDPSTPRRSTEYWTFVRRSGFDASKSDVDPGVQCPACGGPVRVSMAGICGHCSAKVTSGKFGWVLSRIDQDSVYEG
ncbi:MAG TPA: TIM44-like domain-containing protein [Planctomycetota bacterium]|nr:TIM44-like domain-containing protein [Planctomycetota bacterium]